MQTLKTRDVIALGFMTFALFLGAGNIIIPPMVGQGAGERVTTAGLGFLLTGVGLPLLAIVALARVGGGLDSLTRPLGRRLGLALGVVIYLILGPLVATPRTATVSFEMAAAPFFGDSNAVLAIYTSLYFMLAMLLALYPGRLLDSVGKFITPVLVAALTVLGCAAIFWPAGPLSSPSPAYQAMPLAQGFVDGYQTMDALGAMAFGIVIINAIRGLGVRDVRLQTRYAIQAGLIAAVGLGLVYVSLIYLGATSNSIAPDAPTGVRILIRYVQHTFGQGGSLLLAAVIFLACLTTAVGLISACATYFSALCPLSYRQLVVAISAACLLVSNVGLAQLIVLAGPVLAAVYPLAIALVLLSLASDCWRSASRVFLPVLATALVMGLVQACMAAGWQQWLPQLLQQLPGAAWGMAWVLPVLGVLVVSATLDRCLALPATDSKSA